MKIICPKDISVILSLNERLVINSKANMAELIVVGTPQFNMPHISLIGKFSDILRSKYPNKTQPNTLYIPRFHNGKVSIQAKSRNTYSTEYPIKSLEDICTMEELLDNIAFIIPINKEKSITLNRYECSCGNDILEVKKQASLEIESAIPLKLSIPLNSPDIQKFFSKAVCIPFDEELRENIFNGFRKFPGFIGIWEQLYAVFNGDSREEYEVLKNIHSYHELLEYRYYESTEDFYYLAEQYIKSNCISKIFKDNPVISGKPYPDSKSIYILSNISQEILEKNERMEDGLAEILFEMEQDSNVGIDGIKLIKDFIDLTNISNYSMTIFGSALNNYNMLYKALKLFNVAPQTLIDKTIKAMFLENINKNKYFESLQKYGELCKRFCIKINNIPENLMSILEILSSQQAMFDTDTKIKIGRISLINDSLLFNLPESEYTIITPKSPQEMIEEAIALNHNVGTNIKKYVDEKSKIFFVRLAKNKTMPLATIELSDTNNLVQISAFNGACPSQEIYDFVNCWISGL